MINDILREPIMYLNFRTTYLLLLLKLIASSMCHIPWHLVDPYSTECMKLISETTCFKIMERLILGRLCICTSTHRIQLYDAIDWRLIRGGFLNHQLPVAIYQFLDELCQLITHFAFVEQLRYFLMIQWMIWSASDKGEEVIRLQMRMNVSACGF